MTFLALALGLLASGPLRGTVVMGTIPKEGAEVRVSYGRSGDSLFVSAFLPDTSYYWGDDFVVSIDPDGSGGDAPGDGDLQWYVRRNADSSVVSVASGGRWMTPGVEPPRLGPARSGPGWSLTTTSGFAEWTCDLRIARSLLGPKAKIAFRTYDNSPHGWWSVPAPRKGERATLVERTPNRWLPLSVSK